MFKAKAPLAEPPTSQFISSTAVNYVVLIDLKISSRTLIFSTLPFKIIRDTLKLF